MVPLTYEIEEAVFAKAPSFCRGVVLAYGIDNSRFDIELDEQLTFSIEKIAKDLSLSQDHPRISGWQDVYKTFPTPTGEPIKPSIGTLVSRIHSGLAKIPFISPLVAISNIISLRYLMPSGLIDLEKIKGNLVLGVANGTEQFTPFGKNTVVTALPGEIIYYATSDRTVLCRCWNHRGSKQSGIQPDTRTAVIDIDALLSIVDIALLQEAMECLMNLILTYCGGQTKSYYLNASKPSIELEI